jgi:hypothetical protein
MANELMIARLSFLLALDFERFLTSALYTLHFALYTALKVSPSSPDLTPAYFFQG